MIEREEEYCNHEWDSDALARVCFRCGQVRLFPSGAEHPRILWPGRETENDPSLLPMADKALIASAARRRGIKKAANLTGIRMGTLIGWVAFHCREPRVEQVTPTETPADPPVPLAPEVKPKPLSKGQRHAYFEKNREAILTDVRQFGRTEALKKWGISQSTFVALAKRWGVAGIGIIRQHKPAQPGQNEKLNLATEHQLLKASFDGYRQAVLDILGVDEDHGKNKA